LSKQPVSRSTFYRQTGIVIFKFGIFRGRLKVAQHPVCLNYVIFQTAKHKKPTSKDSLEYHKRISCLSPYYNPESDSEEKGSGPNSPVHTINENPTETKPTSQELEGSSGKDFLETKFNLYFEGLRLHFLIFLSVFVFMC